ncbi:MAG TPA: hypothetical protein VMU37_07850 [Caulobacteraceae bacterium]|nr:hypothetical protein [Caulobacteraceae bacterium]
MADVIIGGRTWSVSLPHFKALKAAWRHIAALQSSTDPMESVAGVLGIVSVGSATPVTVEELEELLRPAEMQGLRAFIDALMIETGLAPGEPTPAEAVASPSTATSTTSSAPSWPEPAALTGTWLRQPGASGATAP